MNKYGTCGPGQLVSNGYNTNHMMLVSFFKFEKMVLKSSCQSSYIYNYKMYYSPEMPIPSFRNILFQFLSLILFCYLINACFKANTTKKLYA